MFRTANYSAPLKNLFHVFGAGITYLKGFAANKTVTLPTATNGKNGTAEVIYEYEKDGASVGNKSGICGFSACLECHKISGNITGRTRTCYSLALFYCKEGLTLK